MASTGQPQSDTHQSTIAPRGRFVSDLPRPARPPARRLTRRVTQLSVGLALYGASAALLVRGGLGLEPWGVLHQGLAELTGLTMGVVSIAVGAVVLLLWIPIRQRPGPGTVANVFAVGIAMDATLALVPDGHGPAARIALLIMRHRPQRGGHRALHSGPVRSGAARRSDDGAAPADRPLGAAGPYGDRGRRRRHRFRARRLGGDRHGRLCPGHRTARPALPARLRHPAAGTGSTAVAAGTPARAILRR